MHKRLVKNCRVVQKPSLRTDVFSFLKRLLSHISSDLQTERCCDTFWSQLLGSMDPRIRDTLQDTGAQRHPGWVFQQKRSTDEGVLCELFRDHGSKLTEALDLSEGDYGASHSWRKKTYTTQVLKGDRAGRTSKVATNEHSIADHMTLDQTAQQQVLPSDYYVLHTCHQD